MYVANHIWINIISRNMLNWLIQMANKNLFVISVAQVMLHCKLLGKDLLIYGQNILLSYSQFMKYSCEGGGVGT